MNFILRYAEIFEPIKKDCECYTCRHYTVAYINHLFRADEILSATLATIHNEYFVISTVDAIRNSLLDDTYYEYKENFLSAYYGDSYKQFM